MDRRNTDMKNKIKKILLLGMTAMFTAGAAGTAVISCPVWADEAEQNSETAEEPKAASTPNISYIFSVFTVAVSSYGLVISQ